MSTSTRRALLGTMGTGMLASFVLPAGIAKAAPSERIRHAVIGVGGQGRRHAQ